MVSQLLQGAEHRLYQGTRERAQRGMGAGGGGCRRSIPCLKLVLHLAYREAGRGELRCKLLTSRSLLRRSRVCSCGSCTLYCELIGEDIGT